MFTTYGALYTCAAAMNGEDGSDEDPSGVQGVCPDGRHLFSENEWKELEYHLGMSELIAKDVGWPVQGKWFIHSFLVLHRARGRSLIEGIACRTR